MAGTESLESQASSLYRGENNDRRGDMNMVQLVGRLTADPELKRTANEVAVVRFRVATNVRGAAE